VYCVLRIAHPALAAFVYCVYTHCVLCLHSHNDDDDDDENKLGEGGATLLQQTESRATEMRVGVGEGGLLGLGSTERV
jgi:hypothetical protein